MQTFSQYAATRLLRSHSARAQTFGGIALQTGNIETYAGIDLITGMPVFIYTMPEKPLAIPEVYSEAIPTLLESGFEHGLGFVVMGSAPGYTPLKPILTQPRLEWLVRASSRALADAHSGGLQHGNLEPSHFFASADHLLIEGWGLPWGQANTDYQAPETNISFATDVFAWARCMTMFGKGKPRLMLEGEFGRLVGHCLNPRPSERPTAQELVLALEQVLPARNPSPPDLAQTALELSAAEYLETDTDQQNPIKRTKPLEVPRKVEIPAEPAKISKPELPMPEPSVAATLEPSVAATLEPSVAATLEPVVSEEPEPDTPLQPPKVLEVPAPDLTSPEARLDALEAELRPKSNVYSLEATLFAAPQLPEPVQPTPPDDFELTTPIAESVPTVPAESVPSVPIESEPPVLSVETEVLSQPQFEQIATPETTPELAVLESPTTHSATAQLQEPEHLAADEPDVALPSRASSRVTDDSDADAPRPVPIRIGFDEEDQSWRSVVSPKTSSPRMGRWVILAVLIGLGIVVAAILLAQPRQSNPNPRPIDVQGNPSKGSVVMFNLRGAEGIQGRLLVVGAPAASQLAKGALLATVPGPVLFPTSGEYSLRIEMPQYKPVEIRVRVPQDQQINLELSR